MNIYWVLSIIFGGLILFFFVLSVIFGVIHDSDNCISCKKVGIAFNITLNLLFVSIILAFTFIGAGFVKNDDINIQNFFVDENYRETIEYNDFIDISVNEIKFMKDGSLITMKYKYKAKDFDVKDGIQVYVNPNGTVGIK